MPLESMPVHDAQAHEAERLKTLRGYEILDTPDEEPFDRIVRLVCVTLDVPIALISLIDQDRQWFKARVGLRARQTARDISFCDRAIRRDAPMVVPDALLDDRFRDNPLVTGEPHIRFYAGVPLTMPGGHNIGTLCAIGRNPREVTPAQIAALEDLAGTVVDLLEYRRLATTDPLTGALSRRAVEAQWLKEVSRARRYKRSLGVIVFDVDRFKAVNDTHGHAAGDRVLRALARTVRGHLRSVDIFARIGGEEFCVLLPETDADQAVATAERLRELLAAMEVEHHDTVLRATASFGVTVAGAKDSALADALARADAALYRAKNGGRDRVVRA